MDSPFSPKGPRASSRKSDSSSLKEFIESLLRIYKLQAKYDETYVTAHWEEIMGKPIAASIRKQSKTIFATRFSPFEERTHDGETTINRAHQQILPTRTHQRGCFPLSKSYAKANQTPSKGKIIKP